MQRANSSDIASLSCQKSTCLPLAEALQEDGKDGRAVLHCSLHIESLQLVTTPSPEAPARRLVGVQWVGVSPGAGGAFDAECVGHLKHEHKEDGSCEV